MNFNDYLHLLQHRVFQLDKAAKKIDTFIELSFDNLTRVVYFSYDCKEAVTPLFF